LVIARLIHPGAVASASNAPSRPGKRRRTGGHSLESEHGRVDVSYKDFTIKEVKRRFQLRIEENRDLFSGIPAVEIGPLLRETLAETVPLALAIATEKARSEMIIAPVLLEARRQADHRVGLFSGIDFTVDPQRGLNGVCDFLLSRSPEQLTIEAPVIAVVEAKNEDMRAGVGQCLAEMIAVRLFIEQNEQVEETIYGVVTTGNNWKFLRLRQDEAQVDRPEYYIKEVGRVVGILKAMLLGTAG
jgi:hypothetical protein